MRKRTNTVVALVAMVGIGLIAGYGPGAPAGAVPHPGLAPATAVDPADFTTPVQNPYFPLEPGTVSILRGSEDGERLVNRTTITPWKKVIQGVTTTVVNDVLYEGGFSGRRPPTGMPPTTRATSGTSAKRPPCTTTGGRS